MSFFFLHCNEKQSSNCADLWGNFKSSFWTLCNPGLFNGSLNIGKNYQIRVRLGLKRDFFPPPLFLYNSSLIEISSGRWVAFFPPFIHTDLLSGTKTAPHWERERGNSFFRWRLIRFKLGQFLRKKSTIFTRDCYHRCYLFIHVSSVFQVPPPQIRLFYTMFHCNPQIMSGWYSVNTARKYVYFKTWRQFCINVFRKKKWIGWIENGTSVNLYPKRKT